MNFPFSIFLRLHRVADTMTTQMVQAQSSDTILSVVQLMMQHQTNCVIVVESDKSNHPIGMISQQDIVRSCALQLNLQHTQAREVMNSPTAGITPQQSLWDAFQQMQQDHTEQLAVTNEQGELLGLITQAQLLQAIVLAQARKVPLEAEVDERQLISLKVDQALEQAQEFTDLKSRLIAMTAHQFRTPLAVIASSAGILKEFSHKLDESRKQEHLRCIQTYIKHTIHLLDDILFLNQAEAGNLSFAPCVLDLIDFCQTLVSEMQLINDEYILSFTATASNGFNDAIQAFIDPKLLRQILINLLSNAIKYSANGSTIQFHLTFENQAAIFVVQDAGIGIAEEDQAQLFQPFHRAKTVDTVPGMGLGLAVVKQCVDLHQGQISVVSELDVGTTVTVVIPTTLMGNSRASQI
jgi:signal transduction histidine kinase